MNQDEFAQLCGERDAADANEAAELYASRYKLCAVDAAFIREAVRQAFLHGVAFQSRVDTEFFKETIDHLFKKLEMEAREL